MIRTLSPYRRLALLAVAATALAGCASILGPRDYEVSTSRLQQNLDKRFPQRHTAAAIFDIRLQHPQLAMQPNDRLSLRADVEVSSPLMRTVYQGSLTLSGRLQTDNARNAIFLSDARVENLTLSGADDSTQHKLTAAGSLLADKFMRDVPIYSYQPQDLRYAGVQYTPTAIRTTANGLSIHLEPAR